jgi:hypothetical protein
MRSSCSRGHRVAWVADFSATASDETRRIERSSQVVVLLLMLAAQAMMAFVYRSPEWRYPSAARRPADSGRRHTLRCSDAAARLRIFVMTQRCSASTR